jgi:hypothetical protein
MAKRIAIVQSSYIPWKGYFDLLRAVDEFVLFDDVQFTRRDWRNRNRIKAAGGSTWLTIPVNTKGQYHSAIKDITISDPEWASRHWKTIAANYARAPYFATYAPAVERLYAESRHASRLSAANHAWIQALCEALNIRTRLSWSMDYELLPGKTERLLSICRQAGATSYLTGPSASGYIDTRQFEEANVQIAYADYSAYPEYPQLFPPFNHRVSVLDLIFNAGPGATRYMLSF